jgi:hypothetical protein
MVTTSSGLLSCICFWFLLIELRVLFFTFTIPTTSDKLSQHKHQVIIPDILVSSHEEQNMLRCYGIYFKY